MSRFLTWKFGGGLLNDILSVLGVAGVVIAMTEYFDKLKPLNDLIKASDFSLPGVIVVAFLWGLIKNWPKKSFEYQVCGRDVRVRLVVGDIFKQDGALIVPINNEFDAFLGGSVEKSNSIKAQVVKRFFGGDRDILEQKLKKRLTSDIYKEAFVGGAYAMGTTVTVEQNERRFYLTVNSFKKNAERVEARDEDLVPTLSGLWAHLAEYCAKGNVTIPILGTGNGRMKMQREDVFKEIVRSFIASCSEKSYCDRLNIVVRPQDVQDCNIDIDSLDEFLEFSCKYATCDNPYSRPSGTAVPAAGPQQQLGG